MKCMRLSPVLSLAVASVLLSACTLAPRYERPATPTPMQYPGQYPGITENTERLAADITWAEFIQEARLRQLITQALTNNRDLRVAMLNVERSRAQYRVTRSASFPNVDATGDLTRQRSQGVTTTQWSAAVGASAYEIDFFGRLRSLNQQALETYLATEEAQRSARVSLVAEVVTQYFTWREAQEQLELARQTQQSLQEAYELNRIAFEVGENNELDMRSAEGQLQTARLNALTYERQQAQAENALVLLLGQTLPADLPEAQSFTVGAPLRDVPAGLPAELLQRRPDILQAEHTLKAANANIGAARAALFPNISLTTSLGVASDELNGLFDSASRTWTFQPQINVPLFNAGRLRAEVATARVDERIAVADYEKAIQTAFKEVADALVASSRYASQVEVQRAAIVTQTRRLELANARYRQGEDSYLNVLSAQQDLYSAQQGLLQARLGHLSGQVALYQALGGGWQ